MKLNIKCQLKQLIHTKYDFLCCASYIEYMYIAHN